MKRLLIVLLSLILLGGGGYYFYTQKLSQLETTNALNLVPHNAIYVLEAENPVESWRTFSNSNFWQFLKNHPYLKELTEDADYLDELMQENKTALEFLGNRNFYMSAHMTAYNDYDYLFFVDLKNAAIINLTSLPWKRMLGDDYTVKNITYQEAELVQIADKESNDNLYLTQIKNYLVCSYTKELVTTCIDQQDTAFLSHNTKFKEAYTRSSSRGLAQLYVQYDLLDEYLGVYTKGNEENLQLLSNAFSFTALDMNLNDENALLEGYTSLPDSIALYSQLIQQYGNASMDFAQVLSSRAAYTQVIALNKFKEFYKSVIALRSKDSASLDEYTKMKNRIETILGLNLEKDILSWIGNEIVLAQNKPSYLHRNEDDLVVAVKAYNVDYAKEKLAAIQKRIKRRTPAKFKKLSYKNNHIYYLDIKGFFGMFFGKAFNKLTKPYYTIIDEFIVFSNSPKTLVSTIEDYENGNVLANYALFNEVRSSLPDECALFTYINGVNSYTALQPFVKASERNNYAKNKAYFNFFKGIGISYTSQGDGFENSVYLSFNKEEAIDEPEKVNLDSLVNEYLEDYSEQIENLDDAESFVLTEIEDGTFTKYYKGTDLIHYTAETKKGKFHGVFKEYYSDGTIRSEGKYRKGRKVGRWKYYNKDGELTEKEWEGF
jgi:antitoxin component YwqK of YwqJK toxin-antitoxin module/antitoxin component HigA of HigAB toxin-antitoxin module